MWNWDYEEEGTNIRDGVRGTVKVCLIPGDEMNAYCFGARSIGVTEGALNLDNRTVEAIIAHELGHLTNGDSVLNMVLIVNCLGIIAVLAFYQFALIACVYIIMVICCMMGLFRFSFASYFITSKISGLIRFVMEAAKTIVLQVSRLVISALGRRSESNVSNVLTKSSQNIKIEYSKQADLVPPAVERLALRIS